LPRDLGTLFGGLLNVCISDSFVKERKLLAEGALFVLLGVASSFVTTYLLSIAGFLL
jgi:hypothetical protein